ncbi:MAG: SigE family RNA polymerase sigma factor [Acidimicrobiia bacterium]
MTDSPAEIDELEPIAPSDVAYAGTFDDFVRTIGPRLQRSAFLLIGDVDLADDLVQTALAKVSLRWTSVAAKGDPTAYVRRVMYTTAAGWRRRRWRAEMSTGHVPEVHHLDRLEHVDERLRLREALAALPVRQRAVIVLRFYDDLTETDTAAVLGCSVGTVKSHTARALTRLRATTNSQDHNEPGAPARG